MNSTVILGILVVVTPLVLSIMASRQRRKEKHEDWARQDRREDAERVRQKEVADQAAEAAKILQKDTRQAREAAEQVAALQKENVAHTDQALEELRDGQKVIHTLVNSNVTKEMEARLAGSRRELVGLQEIIDLKKAAGINPSDQALAVIITTEDLIQELETDLADRRRQQKVVEAQEEGQISS